MKIIELTQGYTTTVSDIDYDFLNQFSWNILRCGHTSSLIYARHAIWVPGKSPVDIFMHHLILDRMYGYRDDGLECDHRDRDPLNNRRNNLRWVTHKVNMNNRNKWTTGLRGMGRKSIGYKGVHRHGNKWKAYVWDSSRRKNIHIGMFETDTEAAHAYDKKAMELYGQAAVTNFIDTNSPRIIKEKSK